MRALLVVGCLLGLGAVARAEEPYACKELPRGSKLRATFGEAVTVEQLARWVHGFTCKDIVYAAELGERQVKVTIVSSRSMTRDQAVALFKEALGLAGVLVEETSTSFLLRSGSMPASPLPPFEGAKKIDDTHYEVSRVALAKLLDGDLLVRSARIVPATKNGQPSGFKLFAIRPQSVYAAVGFQNGDLVTVVNGMSIETPDKLLEIYAKLRVAERFVVNLERRGNPVTLDIKVVK
jgi:hypothetical protein